MNISFRTVSVDIYRCIIYACILFASGFRTVSVDIYLEYYIEKQEKKHVFVQYLLIFIHTAKENDIKANRVFVQYLLIFIYPMAKQNKYGMIEFSYSIC